MPSSPLPRTARVSTQGHEILAAPGRLVASLADGKEVTAEGVKTKTRFDQNHRKIIEVLSRLGDIAVASEVRAEFDGMYKVTMTLTPKQPTAVKSLRVVLPYAQDMADYIHACTAEIRSGYYYGFTPTGTGRVWDCRTLGDKTMRVGSFIPYVWLGSSKGGLCWFADSDQGDQRGVAGMLQASESPALGDALSDAVPGAPPPLVASPRVPSLLPAGVVPASSGASVLPQRERAAAGRGMDAHGVLHPVGVAAAERRHVNVDLPAGVRHFDRAKDDLAV